MGRLLCLGCGDDPEEKATPDSSVADSSIADSGNGDAVDAVRLKQCEIAFNRLATCKVQASEINNYMKTCTGPKGPLTIYGAICHAKYLSQETCQTLIKLFDLRDGCMAADCKNPSPGHVAVLESNLQLCISGG